MWRPPSLEQCRHERKMGSGLHIAIVLRLQCYKFSIQIFSSFTDIAYLCVLFSCFHCSFFFFRYICYFFSNVPATTFLIFLLHSVVVFSRSLWQFCWETNTKLFFSSRGSYPHLSRMLSMNHRQITQMCHFFIAPEIIRFVIFKSAILVHQIEITQVLRITSETL